MRKYNMNVKAALAVFGILLSACSSDNDIVEEEVKNPETPAVSKTMTFSASMDGENTTRTTFSDDGTKTKTVWATGDAIEVLNTVSDEQQSFSVYDGVGTKSAKFQGDPITAEMDGTDKFYAFYPATTLTTNTDGTVTASGHVPTIQYPENGTYEQSLHFMSAYSTSSSFDFKNVCALLKITLVGNENPENNPNPNAICRVKVVANPTYTNVYDQEFKYTSITGNFDATIFTEDDTKTKDIDERGTTKVTPTQTKQTFVELRHYDVDENDGHKIIDQEAKTCIGSGTFYMVVLPAPLANGFTIIMEDVSGNVYQRIATKATAFERNKLYDLGTYNCSATSSNLSSKMTALGNDVVDLDLPSGTLWCKKNLKTNDPLVGSATVLGFVDNETDYGSYFSWGKDHAQGTYTNPSRTNQTLRESDDMIYSYSPFEHKYCTPIYAQMFEFDSHFPDEYRTSNTGDGDKGARFTAPTGTGRTIWLPYGGHYYSVTVGAQSLKDEGVAASYWSRTDIGSSGVARYQDAYCLDMYEDNGIPVLGHTATISGAASKWSDDKVTGRQLRGVASNFKIAPIYDDNGKEITW